MTRGIKNSTPQCIIDDCCNLAHGRGLCDMHHTRWLRYGDPLFEGSQGNKARSTHCRNGHAYTSDNVEWSIRKGYLCRTCIACKTAAIQRAKIKASTKPKNRARAKWARPCEECKEPFLPWRPRDGQRFCSLVCFRTNQARLAKERTEKHCCRCNLLKPLSEFYKDSGMLDRHSSICRTCSDGKRREHAYGMSLEQFISMLEEQDYTCANPNCNTKHLTPDPLNVDHDHLSGAVRGLLCGPCNRGMGCFYDNPILLDGAAIYLRLSSNSYASVVATLPEGVLATSPALTNEGSCALTSVF